MFSCRLHHIHRSIHYGFDQILSHLPKNQSEYNGSRHILCVGPDDMQLISTQHFVLLSIMTFSTFYHFLFFGDQKRHHTRLSQGRATAKKAITGGSMFSQDSIAQSSLLNSHSKRNLPLVCLKSHLEAFVWSVHSISSWSLSCVRFTCSQNVLSIYVCLFPIQSGLHCFNCRFICTFQSLLLSLLAATWSPLPLLLCRIVSLRQELISFCIWSLKAKSMKEIPVVF